MSQFHFSLLSLYFAEYIVHRENNTSIPDHDEILGAAFGVGRLHSIYNLKTNQIVENGIIDAEINNKRIFSEPSVTKLSSKYIRFIFYDLFCSTHASHILSTKI